GVERVWDMPRGKLGTQRAGDHCGELVRRLDTVRELHEEEEFARLRGLALALEEDDEGVDDLGHGIEHLVELARAEPHAATVERRVRAARDLAGAIGVEDGPVAVTPDTRVRIEVGL